MCGMRLEVGGTQLIGSATKDDRIKLRGSAQLTSKTLAGVLIKKWPPRMPLGPSLTLIAGIPSLSMAHVCQKPTPAIREIASSVVNTSRILDRSAVAKSEGAIGAGSGQRLEVQNAEGGAVYILVSQPREGPHEWDVVGIGRDFPGPTLAPIPGCGILTGTIAQVGRVRSFVTTVWGKSAGGRMRSSRD